MALHWIETYGGPFLLLASSLLEYWEGNVPSNGRVIEAEFRHDDLAAPATDYDLACEVRGYHGTVPVGPGLGVVLCEPWPTCWVSVASDAGFFASWIACDSDAAAEQLLLRIHEPPSASDDTSVFAVSESPLVLFDSVNLGAEHGPALHIHLDPGKYQITSSIVMTPVAEFVIHFFSRARTSR